MNRFSSILYRVFSIVYVFASGTPQMTTSQDNTSIRYFSIDSLGMTIIEFSGPFQFIYNPNYPPAMRKFGQNNDYRVLINASYFDRLNDEYQHAGWLSINGLNKSAIKFDRQLSHILTYDANTDDFSLNLYSDFIPSGNRNCIEFQTGPLIIGKNVITTSEIQNSINGNGKYPRSVLAYSDNHTKYFIIVKEAVTLTELAQTILRLPLFNGKQVTAVNLDGGSSVALYSKDHPDFCFNDSAKLPFLLGIK